MPLVPDPRFDISGYPVSPEAVTDGGPSKMVSVVAGRNDYRVINPPQVGGAEFMHACRAFIGVRDDVTEGRWPHWYFEDLGIDPTPPPMFARHQVTAANPGAAAVLVDHAMDHRADLHREFLRRAGPIRMRLRPAERTPPQKGTEFLGVSALDAAVAAAVHRALVETFQVKYWFGYPRPETWFDAGQLVNAYPCPPHPSYPAGHGAIAGATVQAWIDHVDLSDADIAVLVTAGRQYAHYRTFSGVHWPFDNDTGFDLGRAVAEGVPLP